ncbi:Outer membrane TonB-dependent transporter, utilization system for glycans and polysaccharides (PUL), SusC family, partial [hydrothermal vent metagenome]
MKKLRNIHGRGMPCLKRILRIMKLTNVFMFLMIFQLSASVYSQNNTLSIKVRNATIREILLRIENQSDHTFLYNNAQIDVEKRIDIDVEDKNVEEILDQIFKGTNVKYRTFNNNRSYVLYSDKNEFGLSQQQNNVKGKVTNQQGEPIPGVTVVVKGTTEGTVTNADGNYSLSNVPGDATLVFSFVGMQSQEVVVESQTNINVTMKEETIGIDEVVAIGYGTIQK